MTGIELHLRIVGVLLLALIVLNLYVPRRFNWKAELATLSLLNRQIFQVHAMFICVILAMFAGLTLVYARYLLEPTPLARALLAGMSIFWLLRLLTQWFVYDSSLWRGHRFNTVAHVLFTAIWLYFAATFAWAFVVAGGI